MPASEKRTPFALTVPGGAKQAALSATDAEIETDTEADAQAAQEVGKVPSPRRRPVRPSRVPLGTRNVLTAPQRPGFVRRFVNDRDDRVKRFLEAGYTIVSDSSIEVGDPAAGKDSPVGSPVSKAVGGGVRAVLMEIPEDWFREDQALKHKTTDELESQMRQNVKHNSDLDYAGELKISRT